MGTSYPGGQDSFQRANPNDPLNGPSHAGQHDNAYDAIEAIETELGTTPSGSESTVAARLTAIENGTRMGTGSIGATQLADSAVDTAAIQDGAVTPAKLATSGRFTFPTGAANGYGFASGAVHLSGTGTPEGVVTAAPGSTWQQTDSTTDVKGWLRWIKATGTGNTGWVAGPEADTGWRSIASWDSAGTVTGTMPTGFVPRTGVAGYIALRRTGEMVTFEVVSLQLNATNPVLDSANIAGFRCRAEHDLLLRTYNGSTWTLAYAGTAGASRWTITGSSGHFTFRHEWQWPTVDTWPASLPGSAA